MLITPLAKQGPWLPVAGRYGFAYAYSAGHNPEILLAHVHPSLNHVIL